MREAVRQVEYARAKVRFCNRTDKAVLVDKNGLTVPVWIPLRTVNPASRGIVSRASRDDVIEIDIEYRAAIEKGLL